MIDPSKLEKEFLKVEDENLEFRTFLKINADNDELDKQFLELHNQLFSEYDCSKCRNCCKELTAAVEDREIDNIAKTLGISKKDFINSYIDNSGYGIKIKGSPCCFLEDNGNCKLEKCKPIECREFPYTDKPERLASMLGMVGFAKVCPVVFEMLERLKEEYGFRSKRRKRRR